MVSGYAPGFCGRQDFRKEGGDKAPLPAQAEAKAGCYAPIFKMWMNPARALDAVSAAKRASHPRKCRAKF